MSTEDDLLLPREVSQLTRVPVTTLADYRSLGTGPDWFRVGGRRVVYRRSAVNAWLAEQEHKTREAQEFKHRAAS